MPIAALSLHSSPAIDSDADVVVLLVRKTSDGPVLVSAAGYEKLAPSLAAIGVSGAAEEFVRIPAPSGTGAIGLLGIGDRPDATALRLAGGAAARKLAGVARAAFAAEELAADEASALLDGAALGAYAYLAYRSGEPKAALAAVDLHTPHDAETIGLERIRVTASANALVRDLVNESPRDLAPADLAERALAEVVDLPVETRVWDVPALEADGFGGILGVGAGSSRPPRLVRLDYAPADARLHLALVGKGITFDSGGLSLKPALSMVGMKSDMAGAAVVLAAVAALARLGVPVRVTGWLCIAENLPSATAIRPNDVLTIRGGTTVEVTNTDAEGRLVLADGIVAAGEEGPDAIIDVATLTGAQIVALGKRTSGVLGDRTLGAALVDAGEAVGEAFWPMPMPKELRSLLDSDVADLVNTKLGQTAGGMLTAAIFLREFVGTREDGTPIPWAHLDIAGPALNEGAAWGFTPAGGTGVAARTLVELVERLAALGSVPADR
ncbi:leucyl aminopeptidase [Agromyces seonyuensis]|uniref:Probable cytosol aminopeptidase n=1 Tax=Agromyces seonyuensis TaxID=2662446 RepID=A0A6I4NZC0_9MICO|nr:leucyl aminopeptidase [Agromyces seonyuensis]MWB99638.1 leucyl aminopeptidase [Agromyces seonyuensis]